MEVEFHGGGRGGGGVQNHFRVKPNLVEVELGLWQKLQQIYFKMLFMQFKVFFSLLKNDSHSHLLEISKFFQALPLAFKEKRKNRV